MKRFFSSSNSSQRGSIGLIAILGIVIIGSVYLANGIFPHAENIDINEDRVGVLVDENASSSAKDNLQLSTLKFQECTERVSVDLLVDNSGSMSGEKLTGLKEALSSFTNKLSDDSLIALQTFNTTPIERVPMGQYGTNKQQIANAISTMNPAGGTSTRDAFNFVNNKMQAAQQQYPNQEFALIFFSDGIPEALPRDCTPKSCVSPNTPGRCFQRNQDPTIDPDITFALKERGIKIYSIALLDAQDQCYNSELEGLMRRTASSSENYYRTFNPDDLKNIYNQITFNLCGEVN